MPKYQEILVIDKLNEIVKLHETKPLQPQMAKAAVEQVLKACCKLGVENARARLEYVTQARDACKKTVAKMEELLEELKNPDYIPEIYKLPECKAGVDVIQAHVDGVVQDGATLYKLMGQFRASWESTVAKVCPDSSFVAAYIAIRTHTMTMGKQTVAEQERLEEYLKRAVIIAKQAEVARKGGEQASREVMQEAETLLVGIEDDVKAMTELDNSTSKKLKSLRSYEKLKEYTGKDHKVCESFVADIETARKGCAGRYKTAEQAEKRLDELIKAKGFLLGKAKQRKEAGMTELLRLLRVLEGYVSDAHSSYEVLEKRLFSKKK